MTVNPGFGGQKFISGMEEKILKLNDLRRERNPAVVIQVDGGIDKGNIKKLIDLGVTDIVMGSAVFKNGNIRENLNEYQIFL